jgi:hypothetical protein
MWRIEKVSRSEEKFFYYFAMCQKKAHDKNRTVKHDLAVYYIFAVCAHGREILYRVPDRNYTANYRALGIEPDSDSVWAPDSGVERGTRRDHKSSI